ncbi:hypothetical protein B0H34DRAFT_799845 [Crassisporium funariophilum]|nr:hypothetical protein B0H34DRAFT_799845 [Crassisporium funariophilum]
MFANALRSQSRSGLLAVARMAVPATRSLSSLVAKRVTAVQLPTTVSRSASRLLSTSQVVRYDTPYDRSPRNPPSNALFIANFPWSTTEAELQEVFSEFGEIVNVKLHLREDGRPRGFAHITFADKEHAVAAVNSSMEEPIHLGGRDLRIDYSVDNATRSEAVPSNRLYFAGFSGDEGALRELAAQFNDSLTDIHFLRDAETGQSLSTGFIEFTNVDIATEVLNTLNGAQTGSGEGLFLSYARPKRARVSRDYQDGNRGGNARSQQSRGGRGGYGGGSGGGGGYGGSGGGAGGGRSNYGGNSRY